MDMAERQAMTLQFLRPAQIDRAANANTADKVVDHFIGRFLSVPLAPKAK